MACPRRYLALAAIVVGLTLAVLDGTIANMALPSHLSPQRFDWISAVALGLVITLIDSLGHDLAWGVVVGQFVVCVTAFTLLVRRERDRERRLLPLDLLRIPIFSVSLCTSVASFAAQLLAFVALPFTFQTLMGFPIAEVGLLMMPWPVALAIVAPLVGPLVRPVQRRRSGRSGAASGLLSTARLTGQSIGAGLVSLLLARLGIVGADWTLLVAAGFAAAAAAISLTRIRY